MNIERARTPWRGLITVLWRQPLWSIPFAVFFGIIYGRGWTGVGSAYVVSLVFAYVIGLSLWAMEHFILPRTQADAWAQGRKRILYHVALYVGTSMAASFIAGIIIHFTLIPGFLGSVRGFAIFSMFSLLFVALFSGFTYAFVFYEKALDRARSEQELHLARRIQRSFLLSQFPEMPRLDVHAVNVSSKQVSGDFYDVIPAGDDAFLIAIADVAGKGVPAALLTSMLQASLRTQAPTVPSTAAILAAVNQVAYRSTEVHQFATFFLARVDEQRLTLTYTNAGHNFPVLYRKDGTRVELDRGGTVVGIMDGVRFEEGEVALRPGDRLLLYTDGINEAERASGEQFGEQRIHDAVAAVPAGGPARDIVEQLIAAVREFLDGTEAGDDMTVLVLRVLEEAPPRG